MKNENGRVAPLESVSVLYSILIGVCEQTVDPELQIRQSIADNSKNFSYFSMKTFKEFFLFLNANICCDPH